MEPVQWGQGPAEGFFLSILSTLHPDSASPGRVITVTRNSGSQTPVWTQNYKELGANTGSFFLLQELLVHEIQAEPRNVQ